MSAVAVYTDDSRGQPYLRAPAVLTVTRAFFLYLLLPIAIVIAFSFNQPVGKFNYTWNKFTFDNWRYWNGVPGIQSAIVLSLEIALLASIIATILGTMIALALVRYGFRGRGVTNLLIFLPLRRPDRDGGSLSPLF